MAVTVSGSNPDYSLQSVLTAQIAAVRDSTGTAKAAPPAANDGGDHTAQTTPPPTNLSTHGIGCSVNHQG